MDRLSTVGAATTVSDLEVVELGFQGLDGAVSQLEVLVETISLGNEL